MQEGVVSITELTSFNHPNAETKIEQVTTSFLDGSFNVFDGVIKTNTEKTIGKPNSTLDDATIVNGINWYFKNIVVIP